MNLTLTWDLFVIVFFAVIVTYSFIIGKHESVKIIVASYVGVVAVQGIGNLLARLSGSSQTVLTLLGMGRIDISLVSGAKLILFVGAIIIFAVRGGFEIEFERDHGSVLDLFFTGIFGFATAGLLLSTLLTYVADAAILSPTIGASPVIAGFVQQSQLMAIMVNYQDLWFSIPALLLLVAGLVGKERA